MFQSFPQRFSAAMDVGLDLRQGDTQRPRDLLIARLFEVKEDERHTLMRGKVVERLLEPFAVGTQNR